MATKYFDVRESPTHDMRIAYAREHNPHRILPN